MMMKVYIACMQILQSGTVVFLMALPVGSLAVTRQQLSALWSTTQWGLSSASLRTWAVRNCSSRTMRRCDALQLRWLLGKGCKIVYVVLANHVHHCVTLEMQKCVGRAWQGERRRFSNKESHRKSWPPHLVPMQTHKWTTKACSNTHCGADPQRTYVSASKRDSPVSNQYEIVPRRNEKRKRYWSSLLVQETTCDVAPLCIDIACDASIFSLPRFCVAFSRFPAKFRVAIKKEFSMHEIKRKLGRMLPPDDIYSYFTLYSISMVPLKKLHLGHWSHKRSCLQANYEWCSTLALIWVRNWYTDLHSLLSKKQSEGAGFESRCNSRSQNWCIKLYFALNQSKTPWILWSCTPAICRYLRTYRYDPSGIISSSPCLSFVVRHAIYVIPRKIVPFLLSPFRY